MKRYLSKLCIAVALLAVSAHAQTPSSGNSTGNSATGGNSSSMPGSAGNNSSTLPPGLERREQMPPGLQNRDQLPPGLAQRTNSLGGSASTGTGGPVSGSGSSLDTQAQAGSIGTQGQFSSTNQTTGGLSPTSTRTNSTTNSFSGTTQSSLSTGSGDRATTASDQRLLTTIRQNVSTFVTSSANDASGGASSAMVPVSFVVNGGIVHLVGTVPSIQQKQRIEAIVQRVPGVTRVVNQIQVSSASTTSATSTPGLDQDATSTGVNSQYGSSVTDAAFSHTTNSFSGTSGGFSGTNQVSGTMSQTNLSATGRTNDSNLPPGLRDRETLPPGLEKRDQLPPGLEQRNGNAPQNSDPTP